MSHGEVRRGGCGLSTWGKDHYYASATFTFCLDRYQVPPPKEKRGCYWILQYTLENSRRKRKNCGCKYYYKTQNYSSNLTQYISNSGDGLSLAQHSILLPKTLRHVYVIVFVSNSSGVERCALILTYAKTWPQWLHKINITGCPD